MRQEPFDILTFIIYFAVLKKVRASKILLLTRLRTTVDDTGIFDFFTQYLVVICKFWCDQFAKKNHEFHLILVKRRSCLS
jgi:hypothetical protein